MSLTAAQHNSLEGLKLNQMATQIISSNIVNANVEGYSRKIITQKTIVSVGLGLGAELGAIGRNVQESLVKDVTNAQSNYAYYQTTHTYFTRLETAFGLFDRKNDLSFLSSDLAGAFSQSSVDSALTAGRSLVVQKAAILADKISNISQQIQTNRVSVDAQIEIELKGAQSLIDKIHAINKVIYQKKIDPSNATNDLADQRDQLIRKLSEIIPVKVLHRATGEASINTDGGQALVNIEPVTLSYQRFSGVMGPTVSYENGSFEPIAVNGVDITTALKTGRLKALIDMRDKAFPMIQGQLDTFTEQLRDQVNAIHNQGVGLAPASTLTARRSLGIDEATARSVIPTWSGSVRIALVNEQGQFEKISNITLGGATQSIDDLISQINTQIGRTIASVDETGHLVLNDPLGSGIVIGSIDGQPVGSITDGGKTYGFSHYFGFNDFFTTGSNLTGESRIGISQSIKLNPQYALHSDQLCFATLNPSANATVPPAGSTQTQQGITPGDASVSLVMSRTLIKDAFVFDATGDLGQRSTSITKYASLFTASNVLKTQEAADSEKFYEVILFDTQQRLFNEAGVNLDEEMQYLTAIQFSYKACAQIQSVIKDMQESLLRLR